MQLTPEQVYEAFRKVHLEENHNFLAEDLQKLAQAFIDAAAPAIARAERQACIDVVRSLNTLVADKLQEVRK